MIIDFIFHPTLPGQALNGRSNLRRYPPDTTPYQMSHESISNEYEILPRMFEARKSSQRLQRRQ